MAFVAPAEGCAYALLDLPVGSSATEVKQRYYQLAKETHPDTLPTPTALASDGGRLAAEDLGPSVDARLQKFLAVQVRWMLQ